MQILCNEETTYGYKKFIILLLSENKTYCNKNYFTFTHTWKEEPTEKEQPTKS